MKEQTNKPHNIWRILAIILIILFVLENVFLFSAYKIGQKEMRRENTCQLNLCQSAGYSAYNYESYTHTCSCFNSNGQVGATHYVP
jgi:hypothetical protein